MLLVVCSLFAGKVNAQWVVSDPGNLAQGIINASKNIIQTSSTAQNMIKNFQETVKIYQQGKDYYDALKSVHNLVKDARKVQKSILLIGEISDIYVNSFQKMLSDENYTPDELSTIAYGYTQLLQESSDVLEEMKSVVNINGLSMSDKERMDVIDRTYNSIRNYRDLVSYYTRKNISVSYLRAKKKKDTAGESVGRTNRLEPGIDGNDAENPAREADGTDSSQPKVIDASHPEFIQMLEQLKKGMKVSLDDLQIKEGETSPPKRYSSGSMILAMENAGQLIEDEELRAQIKGSGIGTSATRAEILKKLFNIKYMALNEKTQVITPTYLGELIYEVVHTSMKQLLNPELTASWEKGLTYVAEGSITPDEYMQKLERFVIGRTYNAVHMGNAYGLRPAFDAVAVFYQNAEKEKKSSRSAKSAGNMKAARATKAGTK